MGDVPFSHQDLTFIEPSTSWINRLVRPEPEASRPNLPQGTILSCAFAETDRCSPQTSRAMEPADQSLAPA